MSRIESHSYVHNVNIGIPPSFQLYSNQKDLECLLRTLPVFFLVLLLGLYHSD